MNRAIFLDRDGTIIEDEGYVHKIKDLKFIPGAIQGLKLLNEFKLFIITNQSGIARGYFTIEEFITFNKHIVDELEKSEIIIEETYFCPHEPEDNCDCRKPNIKFIKDAEKRYKINLKESYVIGDHPVDIEMGNKAGCKTIYILTGHGKKHQEQLNVKPSTITKDLLEAARYIIDNDK